MKKIKAKIMVLLVFAIVTCLGIVTLKPFTETHILPIQIVKSNPNIIGIYEGEKILKSVQGNECYLIVANSITYANGKAVKQSIKIKCSEEQTKLFNNLMEGQGYLQYNNSIFNKTNGKLIGIYNYNPIH
jgi:hypothetical protein